MIGWDYYKTITVSDTNVDADLADFPLLVAFDADPDIGQHARSDGYDIRFTLDDGVTELNFERETFAIDGQGQATGRFWVRVPQLVAGGPGGVAATIRCYYGRPDASDASDPAAVWGATPYLLASHMRDGSTSAEVASSYGPAGTKKAAGEPVESSGGIINECQLFDGTDDVVDFGSSVGPAGFYVECWVRCSAKDNDTLSRWDRWGEIFSLSWSTTTRPILYRSSSNYRYWKTAVRDLICDDQWHHLLVVCPGDTADDILEAELFVDGISQNDQIYHTQNTGAPRAKDGLLIGAIDSTGLYPFAGRIDELRIAEAQSFPGSTWTEKRDYLAAWAKLTWANVASAGHELSWGVQQPTGVIVAQVTARLRHQATAEARARHLAIIRAR